MTFLLLVLAVPATVCVDAYWQRKLILRWEIRLRDLACGSVAVYSYAI